MIDIGTVIYTAVNDSIYDIRLKKLKDVSTSDAFFDSFRDSYEPYYSEWLKKKENDTVFLVESGTSVIAFMKLKIEYDNEDYSDIFPEFSSARRLKISSFKVVYGNPRLSLRMIDIAISEAMFHKLDEIYVTIPQGKSYSAESGNFLIKRFGFIKYGIKKTGNLIEDVYIKSLKL